MIQALREPLEEAGWAETPTAFERACFLWMNAATHEIERLRRELDEARNA